MKGFWNKSLRVLLTLVVFVLCAPWNTTQAAVIHTPANDPPNAVDDGGEGFTTAADTPFVTGDVLANDSDPNSDPLEVNGLDDSGTLGLVSSSAHTAGGLDLDFGNDGLVTTRFSNDYGELKGLALQADGKIVAAGYSGYDCALARYNPDGSPDTSFGDNGQIITILSNDSIFYAVALQSDGKIVTAGSLGDDMLVARYTASGTLDSSFGAEGYLAIDFGSSSYGYALAIQPDGKILIAGTIYMGDADFALARLLPDGTLDADFDGDGVLTADLGGYDQLSGLALQNDGMILAVGDTDAYDNYDFALARYTATGTLDSGFGSGGLAITDIGENEFGRDVLLQPDGKILVGGRQENYYYDYALARYTATGTLDTSFGSDGTLVLSLNDYDYLSVLALQADGKIIAAGYTENDNEYYDFALARLNSNGTLDNSFGSSGWVTTSFAGGENNNYLSDVVIQPDGRILAGGAAYDESGNYEDFALARYYSDDQVLPTFRYDPNGAFDSLKPGEVATDTFVYSVSDSLLSATATVSITINGINDAPAGNAQAPSTAEETPVEITLTGSDPENDPLSGWQVVSGPQHGSLSGSAPNLTYTPELNFNGVDTFFFTVSDGSLQRAQAPVAITVTPVNDAPSAGNDGGAGYITNEETPFRTISILSNDGDIDGDPLLVSGFDTSHTLGTVATYTNIGGALDPSFDGDGLLMLSYDTGNWEWSEGRAVAIQPDGKIVVGGATQYNFTVARFNPNGSLDASFGSGGRVITNLGGYENGEALLLQPDGKIVLGGSSSDKFALARYTASGTLDNSFDGDGLLVTTFSNSSYIHGLALQADGKIVAVGHVWMENGNDDFALARFNPDGSLDTTFSDDGKLTTDFNGALRGATPAAGASASFDHARAALIQPDGKIVVSGEAGGKFGLARYNSDGTLDTTFSGDGLSTAVVGAGNASATSVALQPDGRIVAGGFANTPVTWHFAFAVARFSANGALDGSFGSGGTRLADFGYSANCYGMALQQDGMLVLAGYTSGGSDNFALARFTSSGSLDTSFDSDGKLTTDFPNNEKLYAVALQADGKIVVTGTAYSGMQFNMALARYTPGGMMLDYDPNGQFEHLGVGEEGTDSLIYTLSDGLLSATATVTITIQGVNDAPEANDQPVSLVYDLASSFLLDAGDVDGDVVTNTIVTAPLHGQISGSGLNVTYTPDPGYRGADSFTYYVSDGSLTSATVTVTIDLSLEPLKFFFPIITR